MTYCVPTATHSTTGMFTDKLIVEGEGRTAEQVETEITRRLSELFDGDTTTN